MIDTTTRANARRTMELVLATDAQHLQAIKLGQAQVEQHQIVLVAMQGRIGLGSILNPVHRIALTAQQRQHGLADHGVIFNEQ